MNEIEKALRSLQPKELEAVEWILAQIQKDFRKLPHVIPLAGSKGLYRVRIGKIRIIFQKRKEGIEIRRIGYRNEKTYKNL